MIQFEYVSPNSVKQALGLLSSNWGDTEVLAGGTDLLGLMKDFVLTPKRDRQYQTRVRPGGNKDRTRWRRAHRCLSHTGPDHRGLAHPTILSCPCANRRRRRQPANPEHGYHRRQPLPTPPLLVFPKRNGPAAKDAGWKVHGSQWRQPISRYPW